MYRLNEVFFEGLCGALQEEDVKMKGMRTLNWIEEKLLLILIVLISSYYDTIS